jgi:hypothetical protein
MSTNTKEVYLKVKGTDEMINLEDYTYLRVVDKKEDWKPVTDNIAELLLDKNKNLETVESK